MPPSTPFGTVLPIRTAVLLVGLLAVLLPAAAWAREVATKDPNTKAARKAARRECLRRLRELDVPFRSVKGHPGIDVPVEVTGPVGGVRLISWSKKPLVLDCSLVYSLAAAAHFWREEGITRARYSSAYEIRNIKGSDTPSQHSYGLALDVHVFADDDGEELSVEADFEYGLGDAADCIGAPTTDKGRALKTILCRMERSGLFRFILNPDSDANHYNHFHIEARPWTERADR